jgi:hypothetical protein
VIVALGKMNPGSDVIDFELVLCNECSVRGLAGWVGGWLLAFAGWLVAAEGPSSLVGWLVGWLAGGWLRQFEW